MRCLLLILLLFSLPAAAEPVRIAEVDGLVLKTETGDTLVLPGLIAPENERATRLLSPLLIGKDVEMQGTTRDRWQRLQVSLATAEIQDITAKLLETGAAQLAPEISAPDAAWLTAETKARTPPQGLWRDNCCSMIPVEAAGKHTDSWRVLNGKVFSVTARRDLTYVNFGEDWKTDFTIIIPKRLARTLKPQSWPGQMIEVRGWISWNYGPAITLGHAAQILLPAQH